jgi:hypothetical protein
MIKDSAAHWPSSGVQVVMVKDSATGHFLVYKLLWLRILLPTGHLQVYRLLSLRILLLAIFRCTGCYG